MTNATINSRFLAATDTKTRSQILGAIAKHYGIDTQAAYAEVIDEDAEHLLDYLTEPVRSAARVVMARHGFSK